MVRDLQNHRVQNTYKGSKWPFIAIAVEVHPALNDSDPEKTEANYCRSAFGSISIGISLTLARQYNLWSPKSQVSDHDRSLLYQRHKHAPKKSPSMVEDTSGIGSEFERMGMRHRTAHL